MKLTKVKVENYRSVEDSQEFKIDDAITCLVGKNESGKTTLLTALYRLNPIFDADAKYDKTRDYPRRHLADYDERHGNQHANVVSTWWKLDGEDTKRLASVLGQEAAIELKEVVVSKGYEGQEEWTVEVDVTKVVRHLVNSADLHDEEASPLRTCTTLADLKKKVTESISAESPSPRLSALKVRLDTTFATDDAADAAIGVLSLPKFLMFSQYQRMQGRVSLEQIAAKAPDENDRVFLALCDMAGTPVQQVSSINQVEDLIARFESASNKITEEIFRYWSQNKFLRVEFKVYSGQPGDPAPFNTGRVFHTRIKNELHQVTVPFDDRSTGFVWFFSFLALFSQMKKAHGKNIIVLLDEPGLSLHAKAQGDLIRYFKERLAPDYQVLYSTHSPFMVPSENLMSVRTVEDVVEHRAGDRPIVHGTKVGDDVLSTDRDTLFPLQGALGYEITQSLFVGEHTLLVEGPSDLLYLKAISEELRSRKRVALDPKWTLCPTGGVDKVSAFMSLFGGNKLHVAVLMDFAAGQKKKVEDLRRSQLLRQGHVFTAEAYSGQPEADIEDVLGGSLYIDLVNACYSLKAKQAVVAHPAGSRVVKHVEDHFRTLTDVPEFDHFTPSSYFMENRAAVLKKAAGVDDALGRFERLFTDLNALLK